MTADWSPEGLETRDLPRLQELEEDGELGAAFPNQTLSGIRGTGTEARRFRAISFSHGRHAFTLMHETGSQGPDNLAAVLAESAFDQTRVDWYFERMDWRAEAKYNLWLSIASSLGFAAFVLALGWIRLARIDF